MHKRIKTLLCWLILLLALPHTCGAQNQMARIRQLVKDLNVPFEMRKKRDEAVTALAKIGKPAVSSLVAAAKDKDFFVREAATKALVQMGEVAVPSLINLLQDDGKGVIKITADGTGVSVSRSDGKSDYAFNAAGALGKMGKPAIPALTVAFKKKTLWRANVALALWFMGADAGGAVPLLIEALMDNESTIRALAASTLRKIGTPAKTATPQLTKALNDADASVRTQAQLALKAIKPTETPKK
jgi:HEAT repeat protein